MLKIVKTFHLDKWVWIIEIKGQLILSIDYFDGDNVSPALFLSPLKMLSSKVSWEVSCSVSCNSSLSSSSSLTRQFPSEYDRDITPCCCLAAPPSAGAAPACCRGKADGGPHEGDVGGCRWWTLLPLGLG